MFCSHVQISTMSVLYQVVCVGVMGLELGILYTTPIHLGLICICHDYVLFLCQEEIYFSYVFINECGLLGFILRYYGGLMVLFAL